MELAIAQDANIPILPILVGGTTSDVLKGLPPNLKPLDHIHTVSVRDDPDFDGDMVRLARDITHYDTDLTVVDTTDGERLIHIPTRRNAYLERLRAIHSSIKLPASHDMCLPLNNIYQELKLKCDPTNEDNFEGEALNYQRRSSRREKDDRENIHRAQDDDPGISSNDALNASPGRRLVVLGSPGAGKTTLLHKLMSDAVKASLADPSKPIPVYIVLPDLALAGGPVRLKDYLTGTAK